MYVPETRREGKRLYTRDVLGVDRSARTTSVARDNGRNIFAAREDTPDAVFEDHFTTAGGYIDKLSEAID